MANKNLFKTLAGALAPATDTLNAHAAPAYAFDDRHALAQLAATGCLNDVFYTDAGTQLQETLKRVAAVPPEFTAKCAVYARERGFMKDMPALLCAALATKAPELLRFQDLQPVLGQFQGIGSNHERNGRGKPREFPAGGQRTAVPGGKRQQGQDG